MLADLENEAELLHLARTGNAEAFSALVKHCSESIWRMTLTITQNAEDASDAVQDTFLKAYLNLRFFHDSRFYTWVARIAINEALTRLRRSHTPSVLYFEDKGTPREFPDRTENPEQILARAESEKMLAEAVRQLKPQLRVVLILRDLEGFSNAETARRLHLTVPAVKSRLLRARLRLRRRLEQGEGLPPRTAGKHPPQAL